MKGCVRRSVRVGDEESLQLTAPAPVLLAGLIC